MASSVIKEDIAGSLKNMNEMYFQGTKHELLGKFSTSTGFPSGGMVAKLFDTQYTQNEAEPSFQSAAASTVYVYVKKKNQTTYEQSSNDLWSNVAYFDTQATNSIVDINVYPMSGSNVQKTFKKLYALHGLADADKWTQFVKIVKSDDVSDPWTTEVPSPEMNSQVNSKYANNKEKLDNLIGKVSDEDKSLRADLIRLALNPVFHPFALRRLAFLYIRVLSFYVAMDAKFKTNTPIANADKLAQGIYRLLDNEYKLLTQSSMEKVTKGMNKRVQRYNRFTDGVNEIADTYDDTRAYVKKNAERMEKESTFESRASGLFYVALAIFVVTVVVSTASVFMDMEFRQRWAIAGGATAFAAVAGLAMLVLFTKKVVEGFDVTTSAFAFDINTPTDNEGAITHYNNAINELARDYLQGTMTLLHALRSYRSFGNATYSMAKEYRHFREADEQLRNTGEKYKASYRSSDLYQKKYGATVYLFVVLSLLAGIVAMGYVVAAEKLPIAQPYILGVAGFFAFIVLAIYILEISGYVRTDGDKKYWGVPDTRQL